MRGALVAHETVSTVRNRASSAALSFLDMRWFASLPLMLKFIVDVYARNFPSFSTYIPEAALPKSTDRLAVESGRVSWLLLDPKMFNLED